MTTETLAKPGKAKLPAQLRNLHSIAGRVMGKKCGECDKFQVIAGQGTCAVVASKKLDWQPEWPACGRWKAREEVKDGQREPKP